MYGGEGQDRKRSRHMWSVPARGTTSVADGGSSNSFSKDGRKISVGDCALFKPPQNSPPLIGIIRWLIIPQMHVISGTKTRVPITALAKHFNSTTYFSLCSAATFLANSEPTPTLHQPNRHTLLQLLKQHPKLSQVNQIHAQIVTQAFSLHHPSLTDALIHCHLSAKDLTGARILFDRYHPCRSPPVLLWNLMIRAYAKMHDSLESINLFCRMLALDRPVMAVFPDKYTFTFVITSCSHQISALHGDIVHGLVVKNGFECDLYVGNSMINMYFVYAKTQDAQKVFDEMTKRDGFTWTSLVSGYVKNGEMGRARKLFDKMPLRNDVSWAVVISGFVGNGMYVEALRYFRNMLNDDKVKPNETVLVRALSACAHLGALDQGNWINLYIDKNGIEESSNMYTALIDMYAKCGKIDCANRVFNRIPSPDVHNFTSMIMGLAIHGLGKDVMQVFSQMLVENVKPNEITILAVLKGCSHSGLVHEGSSIFNNMESLWGVVPKIEHYGCYIDLLGRAAYLERAFDIVKSMPINPDIVIWRALLSACRIHRNVTLGEQILSYIEKLNSKGPTGGEVLLSNLYASLGKWERVTEVRKLMVERKSELGPGCSWIEVSGVIHEFRVADQLHPQIFEIRNKLNEVLRRAALGGYVGNTMRVSFDLSEEEKEQAVAWHSEKLAVAFGLMSTQSGALIRIVKNLRTCEDCHSALKAISRVYGREIIVRDRSRFHSFKEGICSCNDYW